MFRTIADSFPTDKDYPERQRTIMLYGKVLAGTFYNNLQHAFHVEQTGNDEYVPIRERRPSVRYALCKTVVNDSTSLLFSEGHFPEVDCEYDTVKEALQNIIKQCQLNELMIDACTKGSVGSVAIQMRILRGRMFFDARETQFLTPVFEPEAPDTLLKIVERYKVQGRQLVLSGYFIADDDMNAWFWFHREWDANNETWMLPYKMDEMPAIDKGRSIAHNLGFVPWVWVKNLPGGDEIDGACTFADAVDTSIEIDYLLSQGGRGLKYASDPTLLIKEPVTGQNGQIIKGAGNALVVGPDGDARMLEINGTASAAVVEWVKFLRELALESINGNRSDSSKLSAAQSGRAMELMNQALIWLADRLRISYGEGALLSLLKMIVKASNNLPIEIDGEKLGAISEQEDIKLIWPAWYSPTAVDCRETATTLTTLKDGGIMSGETAIKAIAAQYDIEDVQAELKLIEAERPKHTEIKPNGITGSS